MSVAGIDFSTKAIDIVLLDDDTDHAEWRRFPIEDKRGPFFAAQNVRDRCYTRGWWADSPVWLIGIEDPVGRFPHTQKALGAIAGAVMTTIPPDLRVLPTEPSEWMRTFLGRSAPRTSEERKAAIRARALGDDGQGCCRGCGHSLGRIDQGCPTCLLALEAINWPQDAYDAYGIAWATRKLNADAIARNAASA